MKQYHHQQPHPVNVLQRVEGKPPGPLRRIVSKAVRHKAVAQFMKRNADQRWNDREQNAQKIGKIEAAPNILNNADDNPSSSC